MSNPVFELVLKAGSQAALADQLGISQQAVAKWIKRGYVPTKRVLECEATFGVPRVRLINPRLRDMLGED